MTPHSLGKFASFMKSAVLGAALFVCVPAAVAQTVTVQTGPEGLVLEGEVLGYDGLHLRLLTEHGPLTLDYAALTCEGTGCPDPAVDAPVVRFSGAVRLGEVILPALTEGFARDRGLSIDELMMDARTIAYVLRSGEGAPVLTLVYRATTTSDGFADLLADEADVVMTTRVLTPSELRLAQDAGLGQLDSPRQMQLVALDAAVPVVSPSQSQRHVPLTDITAAMRGNVVSWSALGGADIPLTVHTLDRHHGIAQWFQDGFLSENIRGDAVVHASAAEMAAAMLEDRGALGILPLADIDNLLPLELRDFCDLGAARTAQSVRTQDYPLTYPMMLVQTRRYMPQMGEAFLDWIGAPEAQVILRRAGVQTQAPTPISIGQQGHRLASAIAMAGADVGLSDLQTMMASMRGQARLSLTFRFDDTGQELDPISQLHARYLARAFADGLYDGQTLTLIGFSDSEGGGFANQALSERRAQAVHDQIAAVLGGDIPASVGLRTAGFGEALPIGCDDTPWGRNANRRVELWTTGLE